MTALRRLLPVSLGFVAASLLASRASAYRPFDGTDADVATLGDFELELGPVHYYGQGSRHYLIAPATVLNFGFAPGWEAVVDFQNYVGLEAVPGQAQDRLLDTDALVKAVIVKGSLQEAGTGPSVAAEFGPLLPNLNEQKGFGASCDVIVSQRFQPLTLHLNSWLQLTRGTLHVDGFEGLIVEGPAGPKLRPVSEVYVEREFVTRQTTASLLLGGIWRAAPEVDLDAGVREARVFDPLAAGLFGDRAAWATEVRVGFTWTVGVLGSNR